MRFTALVKGWPSDAYAAAGVFLPLGTHLGPLNLDRKRYHNETLISVEGDSEELEHAMHAWFQAPPREAPFPKGALLHFSYCEGTCELNAASEDA